MTKKKKYFGTDGIRGRANSSKMNADLALRIGMASASLFTRGKHRHHVLIGKDTRLSNYTIEPALVAGFLSKGMNVYLTGPLPTPGVAALVTSMRCDVGVMISASHNEFIDNGIKIFGPNGNKLSDYEELEIEKLIDQKKKVLVSPEKLGRAKRIDDAGGRYIEYLKSKMSRYLRLDGLKIVIDCANGAAYKVAPTILWELGAKVYPINIKPDGTNVNKGCGSTNPKELVKKVLSLKADIGIALDGDADRCLIVDEKGKILNGDTIIAMIALDWKKNNKLTNDLIVGTVMTNKGLEDFLIKNNIKMVRTKVGDRNIISEMQSKKIALGGEPSGHIILSHYTSTGDGLLASLEILSIMKNQKKKLSFLSSLFTPHPQLVKNFVLEKDQNSEDIVKLMKNNLAYLNDEVNEQYRLIIRKSGTENKIRVMVESKDIKKASKIINEASKIFIEKCKKKTSHH